MNLDLFENIHWGATHWHWWIWGMVLLGVEVFAPGFFFLWFGIAAGVLGFVVLVDPSISWQIQIIAYALLSLASIFAWQYWFRTRLTPLSDRPNLNRRSDQYINRVFTLEQPIINGRGRVRVDDSWWPVVAGEDFPADTMVRVVAVENMALRVEDALPDAPS
jgi:hypothetical protein